MHPKEAKKEKIGTGKISQLSLINSEIIIGVDFTEHDYINTMIKNPNNYCIILYPGNKSINLSQDNVEPLLDKSHEEKQLVVFLIDGTWPCAKKMMRLSLNLKTLPRVSFSIKNKSIFEIKQQPAEYCLSTLESIYYFIKVCNLKGLEKTFGQEDQMINVFKAMIDYQIKCSLDINLASYKKKKIGYSKSSDRKQSKKWLNRNIILID
jgi:DTW domain-containing protein YfiP